MNVDVNALLLSEISFRWKKLSSIIGTVMKMEEMSNSTQSDQDIHKKLKSIILNNKIEIRGDIEEIRYCAIRWIEN